ncbi:MAG: hypothetical protein J3K34DRAFT_484669 [Monoraphidium minutum]|nr:MAG: hypothetical protein J3K34DRAFT_484669 [Monoraphidium minutum]
MRDYVPISHTYPAQKPLMDENGKRRAARPPPDDLRVAAMLKSQQQQQQQQQRGAPQAQPPPAKRPCAGGLGGAGGAAPAAAGPTRDDSQNGGVFHQKSRDGMEVQAAGAAGAQATDFSAFNAIVRSERQQQQDPPPWQQQQQAQQQPQRPPQAPPPRAPVQVTTFDALTSNRLRHDELDDASQLEGIKSLYDFGLSRDAGASLGGLPGRMASAGPPGSQTAAPDGAAGGGAGGSQYDLRGLGAAPWDWSLKTRVRIASPQPLECLRAAAAAGLLPACRALAGGGLLPAGGGGGGAGGGVRQQELAERLQRALLQWQHPAAALGPDALQAMRGAKATADVLAGRVREWRDALRGLVAAVRNGQVPAAYVVGATLFHQPLSVLLLAPGAVASGAAAADAAEPAALVSRSNRQLRAALDVMGAELSMAAAAGGGGGGRGSAGGGAGADADLQQQQQQQAGQLAVNAADGRAGSQLLVRGGRGVQALHLLLLQQAWCGAEGGGDVPALLAPVPFAGAALCPCVLKELQGPAGAGPTSRRGLSAAVAAPPQQYYAEISGGGGGGGGSGGAPPQALVAPWVLVRLSALLSECQGEFEVFTDVETTSSSLNAAPEHAAAVCGGGGGGDRLEAGEWAPSAARLAGRHVRQLKYSGGAFSARLGAP